MATNTAAAATTTYNLTVAAILVIKDPSLELFFIPHLPIQPQDGI